MRITFYKNLDQMLEELSLAMQRADENVQDWQRAIKKGDYYRQETEYGFSVYGIVLKNAYKEEHLKNYRLVRAYSVACPDGEMGDVHVSSISETITKEEFERARANGWK